jgi:hypothetical protein
MTEMHFTFPGKTVEVPRDVLVGEGEIRIYYLGASVGVLRTFGGTVAFEADWQKGSPGRFGVRMMVFFSPTTNQLIIPTEGFYPPAEETPLGVQLEHELGKAILGS